MVRSRRSGKLHLRYSARWFVALERCGDRYVTFGGGRVLKAYDLAGAARRGCALGSYDVVLLPY